MIWQSFPVLYYLDYRTVPPDLIDGITDTFDTYNNVVEFIFYQRTWDEIAHNVTVSFHNIDGKEHTLASAYWSSSSNPYEMKNATIDFDSSERWSNTTMDNNTVYDIEEIAAHEVGHLSGLAHTKDSSQTMSTNASQGDTFRKTLGDGDLYGFKTAYNLH